MKYLVSFFVIIFCCCQLKAQQVTINFLPAINGQTMEGLTNVQVVSNGNVKGVFVIKVKDGGGADVITITAQDVVLHEGVNVFNRAVLRNNSIHFGTNAAASILSQTGRFMEGEYEYCFQFIWPSVKIGGVPSIFENCFEYALQPLTPLLLIDPYDGAEICNTRPGFSWQPPMPVSRDMRYRIVVAEVADKQDPVEALANNRPVINTGNLRQANIPYPAQVPDLKKGQQYVWQVFAHVGQTVVTQSEIWTFTVHCEDSIPPLQEDSYALMKEDGDRAFYIANGSLRFSFKNYQQPKKLEYEIIDVSDPSLVIKKLPRLNAVQGLNQIALNLSHNPAFKDGNQYLLKLKNVSGTELTLRFIYKASKH